MTNRSAGAALALLLTLTLAVQPGAAITAHEQAPSSAARPAVARPAAARTYGIGRPATTDEIKAIDIDVMPDGRGLPPGRGTAAQGAAIYAAKCQSCHGAGGAGGSFDRLVGRESGPNWNFATDPKLVKTVGNYWPYATTLYDYTYRAMPFLEPGTLTPDETYSLVAYILALNKIIPDDAVMSESTLAKIAMPARDRFVIDNRRGGNVVK
jgi:cytochrome c